MKQIILKVDKINTGQWSTLLLELNLMVKSWKKAGVSIELQAAGLKRILAHGTSNKPQAPSSRLKTNTFM